MRLAEERARLLKEYEEEEQQNWIKIIQDVYTYTWITVWCLFRVSDVPPPLPPRVNINYNTPYDDAYNFYGSRDLFESVLPHNENITKCKERHFYYSQYNGGTIHSVSIQIIYFTLHIPLDKPERAQEVETRTFPQQNQTMHRLSEPTEPTQSVCIKCLKCLLLSRRGLS